MLHSMTTPVVGPLERRPPLLLFGLTLSLLGLTACQGPGEEGAAVGATCVESDLVAQCPPGSNPVLGAAAESSCTVDGELDLVNESGAVTGRCYGSGTCRVACRFSSPCPCGVDAVTREGVFCTDCALASACGNGRCEGGESHLTCPDDCAADCTPGEERCQGKDREACSGAGRWMLLACSEGETCEPDRGQLTRCVRNDVQRGGETGEPEPRGDRVDGRIWFGDGRLPPEGTGTYAIAGAPPITSYSLEAVAFVTYGQRGAINKDLARAGFGLSRSGEIGYDWRDRVVPADVDEGDYLVLYGPKRAARYALDLGPPPADLEETEVAWTPDMTGDEQDGQRGVTAAARFSADRRTLLYARNYYYFDGREEHYPEDAELVRFTAEDARSVLIARTGIYRLTPAALALSPAGRVAAVPVKLSGGFPSVLMFDGEQAARPLSMSRAGDQPYEVRQLAVSASGALLVTTALNPPGGVPNDAAHCLHGVDLWRIDDGKRIYTICQTAGTDSWEVLELHFLPAGDRVALTAGRGAFGSQMPVPPGVEVWDLTTGRELYTIPVNGQPTTRPSPDGRFIATLVSDFRGNAGDSSELSLWDVETGARVSRVFRWDTTVEGSVPNSEQFPDPGLGSELRLTTGATGFNFSRRGTRIVVYGSSTPQFSAGADWIAVFRADGD